MGTLKPFALAALLVAGWGCAHTRLVPGTTVADTEDNRAVLAVVELYRQRLLEKDVDGLLILASQRYFEDSGTPTAEDDYGYQGLKMALTKSLARVKSLRYEIKYKTVRVEGERAEVEVLLNGAFELVAESGDQYRRVSDYHRFVLERGGSNKWKFLSGM